MQMAPNKFASMLHRNTNTLTLTLVYVLLEWILIAITLLNAFFSYLIIKYADFFGLARPCVLCSRIDHGRDKRIRKDMICDQHALEISELVFCPGHQKFVKCQSACHNCRSLMVYNTEEDSRCGCCDGKLEDQSVRYLQKQEDEGFAASDSHSQLDSRDDEAVNESSFVENDHVLAALLETESRGVDGDSESIDARVLETEESQVAADIAQSHNSNGYVHESDSEYFDKMEIEESEEAIESENIYVSEEAEQKQRSIEIEDESDFEFFVKLEMEEHEITNVTGNDSSNEAAILSDDDEFKLPTFVLKLEIDEPEEVTDEAFEAEMVNLVQDQTVSAIGADEDRTEDDCGCNNIQVSPILENNDEVEIQVISNDQIGSTVESVVHLDQEKLVPAEDATLVGSLLLTANHESDRSGFDEDVEMQKYSSAVESLKAALEAERKTLKEVYAELEQERNDAAEASAQTMAMISRLQEEKATLQLEASQYQRMMDEQIEFDQEAVLLLDEIVRRRERENQELEKELDLYRKRFGELEKMRRCEEQNMLVASSESISVCCSSFGDQDSDGVSTEDEEHNHHRHHQSVMVSTLDDDPFVSFENERLAILNQLNELEQKLDEGESKHLGVLPLVFDEEEIVEEDEVGRMKSRIEEEVGDVYERLQELEEDNEFLRKCMKSVKKGDEGMNLVQEILQHMRALRRMDT